MVSLLARDLALMKLGWWGGAITTHWTGARSAGFSSARLGCLARCFRARSIPPLCFFFSHQQPEPAPARYSCSPCYSSPATTLLLVLVLGLAPLAKVSNVRTQFS